MLMVDRFIPELVILHQIKLNPPNSIIGSNHKLRQILSKISCIGSQRVTK